MQHWDIVLSMEAPLTRGLAVTTSGTVYNQHDSAAESETVLPHNAMYPDEVIVASQRGVGIYDKDEKSKYQQGTLMVTSHRLVYKGTMGGGAESNCGGTGGGSSPTSYDASIFLPHSHITSLTWSRGFGSWSHPKIVANVVPVNTNNGRIGGGGGGVYYYKFSFRQGGIDPFYAHLERTLKNQLWIRKNPLPPARGAPPPGTATPSSSVVPNSHSPATTPAPQQQQMPTSTNHNNNGGATNPLLANHHAVTASSATYSTVNGSIAGGAAAASPNHPTTTTTTTMPNTISASPTDEDDIAYITRGIGINRVVQQKERKAEEAQQMLAHQRQQALSDVESLMRNANKLVEAIAQLRNQQQQQATIGGGGGNAAATNAEVMSIEAALGVGSIVTAGTGGKVSSSHHSHHRSSAVAGVGVVPGPPSTFQNTPQPNRTPRLFNPLPIYSALSSELLAWLTHPKNTLSKRCVIPLVELFSVYNKARQGESVVSAADFLEACIALTATAVMKSTSYTALYSNHQYNSTQQHQQPLLLLTDAKLFEGTRSLTERVLVDAYYNNNNSSNDASSSYNKLRSTLLLAAAVSNNNNNDTRQQLLLLPTNNSINSNTNRTSAAAPPNFYYELKRYKNGSICLQTPCVSSKLIDEVIKPLLGVGSGNDKNESSVSVDLQQQQNRFITATQFATVLGVHVDIAEELLGSLEVAGVLCRDDHDTTTNAAASTSASQQNQLSSQGTASKNGLTVTTFTASDADELLTSLWTTPMFEDDEGSRKTSKGTASRWYWNWFLLGSG